MAKIPKSLKFEDALGRLDELVTAMESGELGIEESIQRYEEAMTLAAHCRRVLEQAELRVRQIQLKAGGEVVQTPLDEDEDNDDGASDR